MQTCVNREYPLRLTALSALVLITSLTSLAQETDFRVTSHLVQTPVSVTRIGGSALENRLSAENIVIRDNGQARQPTSLLYGPDRPPTTLLFLVESFGTQVKVVSELAKVLPDALKSLRAVDRVGIARLYPGYQVLLEPTVDRSAVAGTLNELRDYQQRLLKAPNSPLAGSRSFEDLARALMELADRWVNQRHSKQEQFVVVVVTDDFALLPTKRAVEVSEKLTRTGIVVSAFIDAQHAGVKIARMNVHALRAVTPMGKVLKDRCVSHFADETAGQVIRVRRKDYASAVRTLVNGLADVYLVGFTPREEELDGAWHRLEIRVNPLIAEDKNKLQVRHRKGYWAVP